MARGVLPPILDPIADNDDDFPWYYGPDGGGFVLPFPKYKGKQIRQVDLGYLDFTDARTYDQAFKAAHQVYRDGLTAYVDDIAAKPGLQYHYNYMQVLVPFGKVHRGKRLGACHDKEYFKWCARKRRLVEMYPLFFRALKHRFDNPRKYEVWREIGERLSATKYSDELNLKGADEEEDEEDEEDRAFIDDSEQTIASVSVLESRSRESSRVSESSSSRASSRGSDEESSDAEEPISNFIVSDTETIQMEVDDDDDHEREPRTPSKRRQKRQRGSSNRKKSRYVWSGQVSDEESSDAEEPIGNFIVSDTETIQTEVDDDGGDKPERRKRQRGSSKRKKPRTRRRSPSPSPEVPSDGEASSESDASEIAAPPTERRATCSMDKAGRPRPPGCYWCSDHDDHDDTPVSLLQSTRCAGCKATAAGKAPRRKPKIPKLRLDDREEGPCTPPSRRSTRTARQLPSDPEEESEDENTPTSPVAHRIRVRRKVVDEDDQ
ncbi:hypothetical protein MKEN_01254000 [Mycena kentingensis (nom. inval.)]|nr:hypothetical protein MKEN_01254000 [Mycena kentingensis (nom. inval.)]